MSKELFAISVNPKQDLCISGRIDLTNVVQICAKSEKLIDSLSKVQVDLSGVVYADSSSLAMLIDFIRSAKQQHKDILFCNMPQFMLDLGRVCGLDSILPINKPLKFNS
jgi:anti-anti-sigma factor